MFYGKHSFEYSSHRLNTCCVPNVLASTTICYIGGVKTSSLGHECFILKIHSSNFYPSNLAILSLVQWDSFYFTLIMNVSSWRSILVISTLVIWPFCPWYSGTAFISL